MRGVPKTAPIAICWRRPLICVPRRASIPSEVGSIGWCMGGGYSLDLALEDPKLKVAVINYGHLATDDATLKKINAAILGIFGGKDRGIPPASVKQFETQLHARWERRSRSTSFLMPVTPSRIRTTRTDIAPTMQRRRGSTRWTSWRSI